MGIIRLAKGKPPGRYMLHGHLTDICYYLEKYFTQELGQLVRVHDLKIGRDGVELRVDIGTQDEIERAHATDE